jgi:hypothetical protein
MSDYFNKGLQFTCGAIFALVMSCLSFIIFSILVTWLLVTPDDSDKGRFDRSGFTIMTDQKTGVQYLKSGCAIIRRDERKP